MDALRVGLRGVLRHSTLHSIHMDTGIDMDMESWIYMECRDILHSHNIHMDMHMAPYLHIIADMDLDMAPCLHTYHFTWSHIIPYCSIHPKSFHGYKNPLAWFRSL